MCEKFIDELVVKLNENCLNKDSASNIKWSSTDVNLDITKCRNHCVISTGYVWNGSELCDNCNKTLHVNLDKLNKSQFELVIDLINSDDKINKLNDKLEEVLNFVNTLKSTIEKNTISTDSITNSITNYNSLQSLVIENNDKKYMNLLNGEQKYLDTINGKLDDLINIFDKKVENIIEKKLSSTTSNCNIEQKQNINNINNNYNNNKYANIKIFNIGKIGGIGIVLTANTISVGKVRRGYSYQNHKGTVIFRIKDFENNFCPTEFEYPDSEILIIAQFIKGNYTMVDLYDVFYCIDSVA